MHDPSDLRATILDELAPALSARNLVRDQITDDFHFLDSGVFDSFGLVEFVGDVEERLGIEVDFSDIEARMFMTLGWAHERVVAVHARAVGMAVAGRSLRLALAIEESVGVQLLRLLAQSTHEVVVVLASRPTEHDKGASTWRVAEEMGLRVEPSRSLKVPATAEALRERCVDVLLNVHSRYIVHSDILSAPRVGAFNVHPAPLPRYAGLNSPSWAIYRGETQHGVTLHHMLAGIDTGPIAYQTTFNIAIAETGLSLMARCQREELLLIEKLLDAASRDPALVPRLEQDPLRREYFGREVPQAGLIAWTETAAEIDRFVRACDFGPFPSPWGTPMTLWRGESLTVTKVGLTGEACDAPPGIVRVNGGAILAATSDQWIALKRTRLQSARAGAQLALTDGDRLG